MSKNERITQYPCHQGSPETSLAGSILCTLILQNPVQTQQHSTNFLFTRAQLQKTRCVCTLLVPRCTGVRAQRRRYLGRTAEFGSGARPAASSSLRVHIPGRRLSLETHPSIGRSATEDGASRSEKHGEKPGRKA